MPTVQLLLIAIVVLSTIIICFLIYFLVTYLKSKKVNKKEKEIFDISNLVEEPPLLDKLESPKAKTMEKEEKFVFTPNEEIINPKEEEEVPTIDPFGILNNTKKEEPQSTNPSNNKYIS